MKRAVVFRAVGKLSGVQRLPAPRLEFDFGGMICLIPCQPEEASEMAHLLGQEVRLNLSGEYEMTSYEENARRLLDAAKFDREVKRVTGEAPT